MNAITSRLLKGLGQRIRSVTRVTAIHHFRQEKKKKESSQPVLVCRYFLYKSVSSIHFHSLGWPHFLLGLVTSMAGPTENDGDGPCNDGAVTILMSTSRPKWKQNDERRVFELIYLFDWNFDNIYRRESVRGENQGHTQKGCGRFFFFFT